VIGWNNVDAIDWDEVDVVDCEELEVVDRTDVCASELKLSSTLVPLSVTVFVIGPKPGPEAVTVIVPDVPMGKAYPPADDEIA
jgi:hypothetical protein